MIVPNYATTVKDQELIISKLEKDNKQLKEIINNSINLIQEHNRNVGNLYFKCSNLYLLSEIKENMLSILEKGINKEVE